MILTSLYLSTLIEWKWLVLISLLKKNPAVEVKQFYCIKYIYYYNLVVYEMNKILHSKIYVHICVYTYAYKYI